MYKLEQSELKNDLEYLYLGGSKTVPVRVYLPTIKNWELVDFNSAEKIYNCGMCFCNSQK